MIDQRKSAFDRISRVLAIIRLDIEHHQHINDLSLNIHGENYFRDIFNRVYGLNLANANTESTNAAYIDLVDVGNKKVIQITTTRTKEKISNSLQALLIDDYKSFNIEIYYLLSKAMPNKSTVDELEGEYPVKLKDILKDTKDLIKAIEALETSKLISLAEDYFESIETKYTDEKVLDLVCHKLVKDKATVIVTYNDHFGGIDVNPKLQVNNINQRISSHILQGLDFTGIISKLDDGDLGTDLRQLIVNTYYFEILIEELKHYHQKNSLLEHSVEKLNEMARHAELDFNKIIFKLYERIENTITITDYNSMNIAWILVSYFFEICDVGAKDK